MIKKMAYSLHGVVSTAHFPSSPSSLPSLFGHLMNILSIIPAKTVAEIVTFFFVSYLALMLGTYFSVLLFAHCLVVTIYVHLRTLRVLFI